MGTVYEIPCAGGPQRFSIDLGGVSYQMRTFFNNSPMGGWCFDLADASGRPLACGRPLVTGCDLLGQLGHLGISGSMFVRTDGDPDSVPGFSDLGATSHFYFEVPS